MAQYPIPAARHIATPLVLAVAAWLVWFGEVTLLRGWAGIAWLQGFQWAALPGALAATLSWLLGLRFGRPRASAIAVGTLGALVAFALARNGLYLLGSVGFMLTYGPNGAYVIGAYVLGGAIASTLALVVAARQHGVRLGKVGVAALAAVPLAAWLLGLATIAVLPALGGARDGIHAIKMGYPVFWVVALLYVVGRVTAHRDRVAQ